MTGPVLIDPFHRALYGALSVELDNRIHDLASGSAAAIVEQNATVAENYAAKVSYIKCLKDVLEKCAEIERERYVGKSDSED